MDAQDDLEHETYLELARNGDANELEKFLDSHKQSEKFNINYRGDLDLKFIDFYVFLFHLIFLKVNQRDSLVGVLYIYVVILITWMFWNCS